MKQEYDDIEFLGRVKFRLLPDIVTQRKLNETELTVTNISVIKFESPGAFTVTFFVGGIEGQSIAIIGDGTSKIQNNAYIITNTGADKTLDANKVYRFTLFDDVWYEDA